MVYFQTKNRNLGTLCRLLQLKMLVYFIEFLSILRPFDTFYGHLVYFVVIWYIFPRFGILYQEKSGNTVFDFARALAKEKNGRAQFFFVRWVAAAASRRRQKIIPPHPPSSSMTLYTVAWHSGFVRRLELWV
jgi:hypothetical protein